MIWKIWKKGKLNSEKIWKIWKKRELNSEKIWKIWRKGKLNSEKIWKIWKKAKLNSDIISIHSPSSSFVLSDWKEDSYNFYTSVQEVVVMQN
jgi:hypothetical protein